MTKGAGELWYPDYSFHFGFKKTFENQKVLEISCPQPLMSGRSNEISQNSFSVHILSISLSELHLNLFKVMCGFGVRRETLEVVPIYFSHSVSHAEQQEQIRTGYLLCFVMSR